MVSGATLEGFCGNTNCKRGENGLPASLEHLRAGTKYCSEPCKKQAVRNGGSKKVLTGTFDPSQTPVLCGFSRDVLPGKASTVNPANCGISRDARA
jgi:hypothetical protein